MGIEIFYVDLTRRHAYHEMNIPFLVSPPDECDFMLSEQYNNSTLYRVSQKTLKTIEITHC